ncbi:hypothetical protein BUALT_Bualt12G0102000 [Buddleja alternifolia]|uniref:Uncharacterized protein n=1 Tax=Buddleja alternifolia TaxID=168488 RepID=A0AAV6WP24_9LAMI|nr:hypothetical protein BUALT_Bualt12G0102000 [Buddleja alternifolia]
MKSMAVISRISRLSFYCIPTGKGLFNSAWICRGFVSATRPSLEAKIDKETCGKVIEAAETVKDGTKQVVEEVKRVGQKVANATGNVRAKGNCNFMMADAAKRGFEKASETSDSQRGKDVMDTAKVAAEVFKDKVADKEK